ncbi:MAG: protein-(glutamine-N5) methyltransferase, release factor-specific [Rhizobiales bacterium NRL2]|jgi:release factor glutamine methyltransferase|nr:MAG: protein-(glutamine-N5) methyltransferase, release factor-specific [Rhizobiales bacterium NRL2]
MIAEAPTVEDLLSRGTVQLRQAGVGTARLDARILLAAVLGREPASLLPGETGSVERDAERRYAALLDRRAAREPVARILGRREFYGRVFHLSPATLEPRPDSETTVDLALECLGSTDHILDVGTGSGCLLLTLLAERPGATGLGADISNEAVATAAENARRLGLGNRATFRQGDWLTGIEDRFDLVISNPPYIPEDEIATLMLEVRDHDPRRALAGGGDGLAAYRAIFAEAGRVLSPRGRVVVEIGCGQQDEVAMIAAAHGFDLANTAADLGGHMRAMAFVTAG